MTVATDRQDETQAYIREVSMAALSDLDRASGVASLALSKGLRHPVFHSTRALWFQRQNRHAEAVAEFEQAVAIAPRDVNLLTALGASLVRLNRLSEGIAAFDAAIGIAPARSQTYYNKGCALAAIGEQGTAIRCFERVIALQPNHADALCTLAATAARNGETKKARALAERALRARPGDPTAVIALAMSDLHEREFARAEQRLAAFLAEMRAEDQTRALALGLFGDALDGQDRTAAAFEAYSEKNRILRSLHEAQFGGPARALNIVELRIGYVEEAAPGRWNKAENSTVLPPSQQHVFLLGFMRSGTTLLEQVLASHPNVENLEERETLRELSAVYLGSASGSRELSSLSGPLLDRARDHYWQRVRAFGAKPEGKIFVDKQPFNTLNLPLIARLFPNAKIVFALRDPRDVVLSCFRRHLEVKPTTFEMLTLTDAAHFYDRVMHLAEIYRSTLPLDLLECRHENLVSGFERCVRSICAFIGMNWSETMRDFDRSTRERVVRSPSAYQVRLGLHSEAIGQWRRYERELSPIIPLLQPWIERFGYPLH